MSINVKARGVKKFDYIRFKRWFNKVNLLFSVISTCVQIQLFIKTLHHLSFCFVPDSLHLPKIIWFMSVNYSIKARKD